jgi:ion channel-forming bestrophin family protein
MIRYNNKHWFKFLLSRGGYFHEEMIISVLVYGIIVSGLVYVYHHFAFKIFDLPATFHTVLGLVIGLLLVFRTNTAYDRWWEGRKQLGALVNVSRDFSIKVKHYIDDQQMLSLIALYPFVLKEHFRHYDYSEVMTKIGKQHQTGFEQAAHKPNFILNELVRSCVESFNAQKITGDQLLILEKETTKLAHILGACERIKNTPIPFGYSIHLKRILLIYLITLPFGFIKLMDWYAVPFMLMVFYTMIGIELMAEEIEEPFGTDANDLPFDDLAVKIEGNIQEIVGFK